ncbi:transposase [Escherichia coli]|nr:transposase [Escherichia coli]
METCFKILQLKFDKKLTNRCIGLTLHISASTVFEVLARFKASSLSWPLPADISHDTLEKLIFPPMNRPGFPGECFICELRLPDHRFRWKHNKLFLLLPEEYGPAFPAIVDCYTSPPT